MEPTAKEPAVPVNEVILLLPHQHGGEQYKKGDKITVTEAQAAWLRKRGVIAPKNLTGVN